MYHVKKNGKGGYILYDEIKERVEEENAIRERALSGRIWQELEVSTGRWCICRLLM